MKMKNWRRVIALLLAMVMVFAMTACGGGSTPQTTAAGGSGGGGTPSGGGSDSEEPYEIVIELVNYGMDIPDLALIEEKANEIVQPAINATIKFITVPVTDQFMKLNLWVSGNEKVDLAMTGITTNPQNLVGQGVLMPITEYIENSEILYNLAKDYLPACTIGGEIYCYPGVMYPAKGQSFQYSLDLAKEYNIDVPEQVDKVEDLIPVFEAVLASGMDAYPLTLGDGTNATSRALANMFDDMGDLSNHVSGVLMLSDPDTVVNVYATDEYRAMVLQRREWYEKGYIEPTSYSSNLPILDSMAAGMCFGMLNGYGATDTISYYSSMAGKDLGLCKIGDPYISNLGVTQMSWGIPVTCENPEKVIAFMELMFTNPELANLLNYGIEGKHYVHTDDEMIITYPEGENGFTCGYGTFINFYGDSKEVYQMLPNVASYYDELPNYTPEGGATIMPSYGYMFDQANVTTEVTAVTNVVAEYRAALEFGIIENPGEYLDQFIAALENAGIDKIIAENQAQFDAWKASK